MPVTPRRSRPLARRGLHGLLGWALLAAAVGALLAHDGARADVDDEEVGVARGATVYAANCTVCHGDDGRGEPGTGRTAGPPIDEVGAAYVDLTLRTARMPLHAPEAGVVPPPEGLSDADRESLVAWMVEEVGIEDDRPADLGEGDIARGHELYATHCAQCHGASGAGGVSGEGTLIRPVIGVDRVATVEAIRVGPFRMPRFGEAQLSHRQAVDVATFVAALPVQPRTPLGLFEIDRFAMALLALVLMAVVFAVVLLISHPVDLTRRRHEPPPEGHR